jgi:hypothetical protein
MINTNNKNDKSQLAARLIKGEEIETTLIFTGTFTLQSNVEVSSDKEYHILLRSFEDLKKIKGIFIPQLGTYIASILSPGPISYKVHRNIVVTLADDPILDQVYSTEQGFVIVTDTNSFESTKTLLVDISTIGRIRVLRPGLLLNDLETISPVPISKDYDFGDSFTVLDSITPFNLNLNQYNTLLAPKELIASEFPGASHTYFTLLQDKTTQFFNLGSMSSPKTILNNLYKNISRLEDAKESLNALIWVDSVFDNVNEVAYYLLNEIKSLYGQSVDIYIAKHNAIKVTAR